MKVLTVHPGPLMYTEIYLRLEPLGLELVAEAARQAGHDVRLIDLQAEPPAVYTQALDSWRPDVVAISCNYLPNVPETVDLAKAAKARLPGCTVVVGGHSASFIGPRILEHAEGAVDCVLRGEGEAAIGPLLEAVAERASLIGVPGAVTAEGKGPPPAFVQDLNALRPARDLVRKRHKYFIGHLDPAASIEFSRGCPWDCSFCSAWTFYGRSYRTIEPEVAAEELARIREPGVFIVDDVAFIHQKHGLAIAEEAMRRGIKKHYYLETRGDVLLRNKEVFRVWRDLGLKYMFLGLEAIDEEGLKRYRKRVSLGQNFEALEYARSLGIQVAVNIIADTDWDRERFRVVREWAYEVPEIVNVSVNTPYPGTETWFTEAAKVNTRDYRLFDIQHAVLPTRLPLHEFYAELVETQRVLQYKHLGFRALKNAAWTTTKLLAKGQTNFFKMLWRFNSVYDPDRLVADHNRPLTYEIATPPPQVEKPNRQDMYVLTPERKKPRDLDRATEAFVDETRG